MAAVRQRHADADPAAELPAEVGDGAAPRPTPWAAGRLDGRRGPTRLLFGRTFEDPAIEAEVFPPSGPVLCIAGAGDTARYLVGCLATPRRLSPASFAARGVSPPRISSASPSSSLLASDEPDSPITRRASRDTPLAGSGRRVLAVDINPQQVEEVRRRLAGRPPRLGTADRLLGIGRRLLVPLGWRPARLARFCRLGDPDEQVREWRRLTGPLVRKALAVGLSPWLLGLVYGPGFTRLVPPDFGDRLVDRIGRRIAHGPNRANPWLAELLTGNGPAAAPPTARPPGAIELRCGDVADVLARLRAASLAGISLSNVLDGPGPRYRDRLLAAARRAARPGAPIVVRTLLEPADARAAERADRDRSLIWGGIDVHRA